MFVEEGVTDRVPAEAGEVWQQRIRISRTAGEKAFANADILQMCGGRRRSRWLQYPEFAGADVEVSFPSLPTTHRSWSVLVPPAPAQPRPRRQGWTRNSLMTGHRAGRTGCPPSQKFWLVAPHLRSIFSCSSQSHTDFPHKPTSF